MKRDHLRAIRFALLFVLLVALACVCRGVVYTLAERYLWTH